MKIDTHLGLLVRLESKPGKEAEVEKFLRGGLALVQEEPATTVWYGLLYDLANQPLVFLMPFQMRQDVKHI